jgi:glycosyltransferase involved in cell wall biosynthesis
LKELEKASIKTYILGKRSRFDVRTLIKVASVLREYRPDIVHCFLSTAGFWVAIPALFYRIPVRIYAIRNNPHRDTALVTLLERLFILKVFNYVTCVCQANKRDFLTKYRYPADKVVVIRNGVALIETQKLAERCPEVDDNRRPLLGVAGRLDKQKGHSYILHALKKISLEYPQAALWVIGDGPLRAELQAMARALGVDDRVTWFGNRADILDLLDQIDIYISGSLWEGIPNALLEAIAAGKPIVATRVDGVMEILDSDCAVLVPPADPEALANGVLRLMKAPDLAASLAQKAWARVQKEFDIRKIVREYEDLYQHLFIKTQNSECAA